MRTTIFFLAVLFSVASFSQSPPLGSPIAVGGQLDANFDFTANIYNQGTFRETSINFVRIDYATIKLPDLSPKAKGTIYSFKDYNNRGFLTTNGKNFKLDNINFNLLNNTIESQVSKDSVYVFDLQNVDYATINGKKYRSQWLDKGKRIIEVVFEGKEFSILKNYTIEVRAKDASSDPLMVKKEKNASFVKIIEYWIEKGDDLEKISPRKKSILALVGNKSDAIKKYVKQNKLSYKKDRDLERILKYYDSI